MSYSVLLIEDDKQIQEVIVDYFNAKSDGEIILDVADNGEIGLDKIYEASYDLIILDIMMPKVDGFTVCKEVRKADDIPVVFVTARGREEDILYGYDLGCDDYIVKPFSLATLYAKIYALLKRSKGEVLSKRLTLGDITIDSYRLNVYVKDQLVLLPPKEFAILKYLMDNPDRTILRDTLLIRIWGYDYEGNERVLDNHIKKLRKALGSAGRQIKTVFGRGYKMVE